jgi:hypothetical protein
VSSMARLVGSNGGGKAGGLPSEADLGGSGLGDGDDSDVELDADDEVGEADSFDTDLDETSEDDQAGDE